MSATPPQALHLSACCWDSLESPESLSIRYPRCPKGPPQSRQFVPPVSQSLSSHPPSPHYGRPSKGWLKPCELPCPASILEVWHTRKGGRKWRLATHMRERAALLVKNLRLRTRSGLARLNQTPA